MHTPDSQLDYKFEAERKEAERLAKIEAERKEAEGIDDVYVSVPITLIEAVGHIGVDTGYGVYELEKKWVDMARHIFDEIG